MPFSARFVAPKIKERPPLRGYVYDSETAPVMDIFGGSKEAVLYMDAQISDHKFLFEKATYLIPFVWGYRNNGERVNIVEVNAYCDIPTNSLWPGGNAEKISHVIVNGKREPERRSIGCEESDIVIGMEAAYRRRTRTFEEFIEGRPNLGKFEPPRELEFRKGELVYLNGM